jgi:Flp pilus assembly pilin Flp
MRFTIGPATTRFWRDEDGGVVVEYAVICSAMSILLGVVLFPLWNPEDVYNSAAVKHLWAKLGRLANYWPGRFQ